MTRQINFNFPLEHGLHARPASIIQEITNKFASIISWKNNRTGNSADCKSTLALMASDTWKDDPCTVFIDGHDEQEAETTIKGMLETVLPKSEEELPEIERFSTKEIIKEIHIPRIILKENNLYFAGTPANTGIARASVLVYDPGNMEPPSATEKPIIAQNEINLTKDAIHFLEMELIDSIEKSTHKTEKEILDAHLSILLDKSYIDKINEYITGEKCPASIAVYRTSNYFSTLLQHGKSVYIRQRLADIKDISNRLISRITGIPLKTDEIRLTSPSILAAEDISPSDFISLDKNLLKGLILSEGGTTSHCVILARAFNIPTITGIERIHKKLHTGEDVIIDASRGLVIPSPCGAVSRFYEMELEKQTKTKKKISQYISLPGLSSDGKRLEVAANIGSVAELEAALLNGAEGVGLFRTEMIFMNRASAPTEEEQFQIYSSAAQKAGDKSIIIRTLDIGGDKPISYLDLPQEANPFLGRRAVRLYDQLGDLIDTQLRALLRASAHGNLQIMFPMIACTEEVLALKTRLTQIMQNLKEENIGFNENIPVGIMVEIPSVAFEIETLCAHIDFFSIGSNDLSQYFYAADRSNPLLGYLYSTIYPSFLRLLHQIVSTAHKQNKWVGICGEIAGNIPLLPVMLGLGFDEISLSSPSIPAIKSKLHQLDSSQCESLVSNLLRTEKACEIDSLISEFPGFHNGKGLISVEIVNTHSTSASKDEAIRELIDLLDFSDRIKNSDEIEKAVWKREAEYSTGIGFGVAIPHCQSSFIRDNSIGFLKLEKPIEWGSLDDEPVDMVIMFAVRAVDRDTAHMKMLSILSRKLMDDEFRENLRKTASPDEIVSLINGNFTPAS